MLILPPLIQEEVAVPTEPFFLLEEMKEQKAEYLFHQELRCFLTIRVRFTVLLGVAGDGLVLAWLYNLCTRSNSETGKC